MTRISTPEVHPGRVPRASLSSSGPESALVLREILTGSSRNNCSSSCMLKRAAVNQQKNQHDRKDSPDNQQHRQSRHSPPRSRNEPVPHLIDSVIPTRLGRLKRPYYRPRRCVAGQQFSELENTRMVAWLHPRSGPRPTKPLNAICRHRNNLVASNFKHGGQPGSSPCPTRICYNPARF